MSTRDDFPEKVKSTLAKRANYCCSSPSCGRVTAGPDGGQGVASIGVAAHIRAAAPGGARYDVGQSNTDRKSIENGIWLCASCSRLVDSDPKMYTVELLQKWKRNREEGVRSMLQDPSDNQSRGRGLQVSWSYIAKEPWIFSLSDAHSLDEYDASTSASAFDWLVETGCAPFQESRIRLIFSNPTDQAISITGISAQVKLEKPYSSALVYSASAGANDYIVLVVDLEDRIPTPKSGKLTELGEVETISNQPFFDSKYLTVDPRSNLGVILVARALNSLAYWTLAISTLEHGQQAVVTVDQDGRPFLTSGRPVPEISTVYEYCWSDPSGPPFVLRDGCDLEA